MKVAKSELDASVNFITPAPDGGFFESRYVRREQEYFICYLSSHSGCNRGCQFCHLTTTKQFMMTPATIDQMVNQAREVFDHYSETGPNAKQVHFNWMARGEPLLNRNINETLLSYLFEEFALDYSLLPKFNVSTIMPVGISEANLGIRFAPVYPTIYYSLYSLDPEFRAKWLPGAMDPEKALDMLAEYQQVSQKILRLHGCFIKGENDEYQDIVDICEAVQDRGILAKMNIVRFNPPEGSVYEETEHVDLISKTFWSHGIHAKVVSRVGNDVKASCGTFFTGEEYESLPS